MEQKLLNIFMDRTFDASCVKRAGEDEWASQIINRLKGNYPNYADVIEKYYDFYLKCPMADYIKYRMEYMLNHKNTLKLKYK